MNRKANATRRRVGAPSATHGAAAAATSQFSHIHIFRYSSAHVLVELARRQTLRHPSGECDNTAPGGIRFPIHSGTLYRQFHLPTINSISVIINLQDQPSSETLRSFSCSR